MTIPSDTSPAGRTALVAGATGLVGSALLWRLLHHPAWEVVVALGRRPSGQAGAGLIEVAADLATLDDAAPPFPRVDDAFCCLGTTRAKAGSLEAFERVDRHFAVAFARLARRRGAQRLLVVSSMLADADSGNDYLRIKGQMEKEIRALTFESLVFVRPSLLLGKRAESRPLEALGIAVLRPLAGLFVGPLARYRPVTAEAVADTLVRQALAGRPGVEVVESNAIG